MLSRRISRRFAIALLLSVTLLLTDFVSFFTSVLPSTFGFQEIEKQFCQCSCNDTVTLQHTNETKTSIQSLMFDPFTNETVKTHWGVNVLPGLNLVRVIVRESGPNSEYSVIAVSTDNFTVPGIKISTGDFSSRLYNIRLPFAGEYDVVVRKICTTSIEMRQKHLSPVVPSRPLVKVVVSYDICPDHTTRKSPQNAPPCQGIEHDAMTRWEGHWLGPAQQIPTDLKMRTGWSFVSSICKLETFTSDDIEAASLLEATSIAVLGTSRERGVFLTLVDMALRDEEKFYMRSSRVDKCWGRAQVRLNNLEFIYQDTRTDNMDPFENSIIVTCHAEKVAYNSRLLENTTIVIRKLMEQAVPPKVVLLFSGCLGTGEGKEKHQAPLPCMIVSRKIIESFPTDWLGTIYLSTSFLRADPPRETRDRLDNYYHNIEFFSKYIDDKRVRILDLFSLSNAMLLHAEYQGKIYASTHHHRWCDDSQSDMEVCSNVTEALGNLILGRAIASRGKDVWLNQNQKVRTKSNGKSSKKQREIVTCTDCPASLLPFHVQPDPNMTCVNGNLVEWKMSSAGDDWSIPLCPEKCMSTHPLKQSMTQSGLVDVRVCNVSR